MSTVSANASYTKNVVQNADKKEITMVKIQLHILFILIGNTYIQFANGQIDTVDRNNNEKVQCLNVSEVDNPPRFIHDQFLNFERWLFYELNKPNNINKCLNSSDLKIFFTITSKGIISDVIISVSQSSVFDKKNSIPYGCQEMLKKLIIRSDKYWIGGTHMGKPVSVYYSIPIKLSQ